MIFMLLLVAKLLLLCHATTSEAEKLLIPLYNYDRYQLTMLAQMRVSYKNLTKVILTPI